MSKVFIIYKSGLGNYVDNVLIGETEKTLRELCKEFTSLPIYLDASNFNPKLIAWLKDKYKFEEVKYEQLEHR